MGLPSHHSGAQFVRLVGVFSYLTDSGYIGLGAIELEEDNFDVAF